MRHRLLQPIAFLLTALIGSGLGAQTVKEAAVLLDQPDGKPTSIKLAAGAPVKTVKRQGFWVEVDASGKTGWLKVSQINFSGGTGGSTSIDTGRLGTGNIVATSAARGLSAKDLVSGQPNLNEANKLEGLTADPPQVQAFLVAGGVQPLKEKIQLTIPKPSPAPTTSDSNSPGAPSGDGKKKGNDDW